MKILELRFKNLNSLYGEWCIDFTHPEYMANGIFALTGPTGVGKSTVLDAICLALYGATPRLGKITSNSNEIMSRQTGECYAEVLFASQVGRFRSHWEQRRARKQPTGNLQEQEHQIIDADTGKPIETKKSLVGAVIEEKTGMDFVRFTRSSLLAQGDFDTFLKANEELKSKILEQITGTEIYSQISCRAYEYARDQRRKLGFLLQEIDENTVLTPEEEKALQEESAVKQQQVKELDNKLRGLNQAITWRNNIAVLQQELHLLATEQTQLQVNMTAFQPERLKLEQAMQSLLLDGSYAALRALRQKSFADKEALEKEKTSLPTLELAVNENIIASQIAEQQILKIKEDSKRVSPLLQKIRLLDPQIATQNRLIIEEKKVYHQEIAKITKMRQAQEKERVQLQLAEKTLASDVRYLEEHAQDEWLIGGLGGIEEQFNGLQTKQKEIEQKILELKDIKIANIEATKQCNLAVSQLFKNQQALASITQDLQKGRELLRRLLNGKLLREYYTEKETLLREQAFIRKIEELESQRLKLIDGQPCPLCGAIEHPFAVGNIPVIDETEQKIILLNELIKKVENQEAQIKKLEQAEIVAGNHFHTGEKLEVNAKNHQNNINNKLAELEGNLDNLRRSFSVQQQVALEKLLVLGIREIPADKLSSLLNSLRERLKVWLEHVQRKAEAERQMNGLNSELKRLEAVIETHSTAVSEKQNSLSKQQALLAEMMTERQNLYGEKNPDEEEKGLELALITAESGEKKIRGIVVDLQQQLTTIKDRIKVLQNSISQVTIELAKAEADFSRQLQTVSFASEEVFLAARLTTDERELLTVRAKELDRIELELKTKQNDRELCLKNELAKELTGQSLVDLELQHRELTESLSAVRDDMVELKLKLSVNEKAKEHLQEKQLEIAAQKKECRRWDNLCDLIGSADGKRYRSFAQALTFELMVSYANRQLIKMTDRYLLVRDEQKSLELNVIDNYQAGEIRSTKNLSGGESFVVSLALALGLSQMSSQNVRVDSLFLDEGFGTLDEESLETALATLSGLPQDGKLIGVISHVSALKDSISTQINVVPASGGRSLLVGPGCFTPC